MATLAESINEMASFVGELKKKYRLTENTIMRIMEITLNMRTAPPNDDANDDESLPMPATDEELAAALGIPNNIIPFPGTAEDLTEEPAETEIPETPEAT